MDTQKNLFFSSLSSLILILMTSCPASDLPNSKTTPEVSLNDQPDSSMQVFEHKLTNGLTVYLSPNKEEPRFYAEIVTRAGSKHDPSTNTGLAHYLEHLLFKGTKNFGTTDFAKEKPLLDQITDLYEKRSQESNESKRALIYEEINRISLEASKIAVPNEMDKVYSDIGGKGINAHTWHEETVYKVDLPANRLEHWAKIESERFANPVFRLFHTELETVYEEKNRAIDNKDRLLNREVNNLLFKVHPYGQQSTLGTIEHLKNPSITAIEEFYAQHYVPENMAICISGDIEVKETIELIEKYFSSWQNQSSLRPEPTWEEKPLQGREYVEVKYLGEEQVLLAFQTAPRFHEDYPALRLIDMILDNSVAGLINLNLVEKQAVRSAGCFPQNYNDLGAHYLYGMPKDGQSMEEVERLLLSQVELVKKGEFEEWILPAVINDFKKRQKENLESNPKRVEMLRDTFLSFVEWETMANEIADLEEVTKEEIIRVANKYYLSNYVAGFRIDQQHDLPSIEKPKIDPLKIDPDKSSEFMEDVAKIPHNRFEPKFIQVGKDYQTKEITPGVTLFHVTNPLNDLFSIEVRMEMGNDHQPMLPYVRRMLNRAGAGDISSEDLKIEWYKLATDFGFGVHEHHTSFSLNGLDENFETSLDLTEKHLQSPTLTDDTWKQTVKIMLSERDDEQKDPRALSNALAHFHRYGSESRYLKRPSDAELNASSPKSLSALITDVLSVKRSILYFGPRSIEEVEATVLGSFIGQTPSIATPSHVPNRAFQAPSNQIYFVEKEMAQAQVRLECSAGTFDESKIPSAQLYNEYFGGGMAGLVFQELREARALAYSAWAHYFTPSRPREENILVGAIGCQADKTIEALDAFIDLLDNMPINETRWESAHTSILSTYRTNPIASRSIPGFAFDIKTLGLQGDPREDRYEKVRDMKMADLQKFYEEEIKPKSLLISVVGDSERINLDKLKEFGPLTQFKPGQLFKR